MGTLLLILGAIIVFLILILSVVVILAETSEPTSSLNDGWKHLH